MAGHHLQNSPGSEKKHGDSSGSAAPPSHRLHFKELSESLSHAGRSGSLRVALVTSDFLHRQTGGETGRTEGIGEAELKCNDVDYGGR